MYGIPIPSRPYVCTLIYCQVTLVFGMHHAILLKSLIIFCSFSVILWLIDEDHHKPNWKYQEKGTPC